ncbi:ATP-binding protein [Listeria fleischmannii]|uniref:DNA segregation ATPase FtsK/SpoIIIE family protein n=1 Tax=Listeria fleischmannii FSL S10-1203 TaxID=1265822 RepID=W7DLV0_9LIST|nr:ATP-binding protein [Listeria fleischmannii]EUJ48666.1 DNA segregation ATPase FtsK/SpoIIIE family protein [Listeria fleischmannii FSL S10-1203]
MERFLEEMNAYKSIHLWQYPQDAQLKKRLEELESDFADDVMQSAKYYADETTHILKGRLGTPTKSDFVIGVHLPASGISLDRGIKENVQSLLSSVNAHVLNALHFERMVYDDVFHSYENVEENLLSTMLSIGAERLTQKEMMYLNRFSFVRGMEHDMDIVRENMKVADITNTVISPQYHKCLKLTAPEGESYVTSLTVDDMGDDMSGMHLFYDLQKLPFPVEVSIKATIEGKSVTKPALGFKDTQIEEKMQEQMETKRFVDSDIDEASQMIQTLQESLKQEENCLWNWVATIVVTGKTKKEALANARDAQKYMKDLGISCKIPVADQLQLFYRNLPAKGLEFINKDWQQKTLRDGLAETLFGATAELGNKIGWHIGWIDRNIYNLDKNSAVANSRDFVLFHPMLGNQQIARTMTKSPHILISGDTGEGKTFLSTVLFIYTSMMKIKTLFIDPKKDRRKHIEGVLKQEWLHRDYPLFADVLQKIQFVTLDAKEEANWGALDPIQLFNNRTDAKEMIQIIIHQVYDFTGTDKDVIELAFLEAIDNTLNKKELGGQVGTIDVIKFMQQHGNQSVQNAGNLLYQKIENSILKLLIHDGSNPALSLEQMRTVLEVENLDLPDAETSMEDYTPSQLASSAVMFALGRFCELFGSNPDERTMEFMDEAWIFNVTQQGRKVKKTMRRVGRSQENALCFMTQKIADEDTSNFGTAFAFKESEAIPNMLDFMKMADTEENRDLILNMHQGQCMYRDLYAQVGKISIECLFEEWADTLETVKKTDVARAEEAYL